jgi:hypothetical protein
MNLPSKIMVVKSFGLLAVAVLVFLVLAGGLVWFVLQLIKGNQGSTVAELPFVSEQEVRIENPGTFVVLLEVPRLASDFRSFQIEATDRQSGQKTTMQLDYFGARSSVSGVTTVRIPYGRVTVTQPGGLAIHVSGMQAGKDYSNYRLVLSRPYAGRMVFQIIGIVFCGVGMLLSIIWSCWMLGLVKPVSSTPTDPSFTAPAGK